MEILRFLLSFFLKNSNAKSFAPIFELLEKNSFDIGKTLKSLNPESLAPILELIMKTQNKKGATSGYTDHSPAYLAPIASVADKEIVYTLNKYFCSE